MSVKWKARDPRYFTFENTNEVFDKFRLEVRTMESDSISIVTVRFLFPSATRCSRLSDVSLVTLDPYIHRRYSVGRLDNRSRPQFPVRRIDVRTFRRNARCFFSRIKLFAKPSHAEQKLERFIGITKHRYLRMVFEYIYIQLFAKRKCTCGNY